jgi:hypothetical protein
VRTAVIIGWLAGVALVLAGLPLWAALAVPVAATGAAAAYARWGAGIWSGLRTAVKLRRLLKRAVKMGGAVERA